MNNKIKVLIALLALVIFMTVFHFYRQKEIDTERHSATEEVNNYYIITNYTEPVIISYLYLSQLNDLLETKDQKQINAFINAGSLYISQTNSLNLFSIADRQYNKYYNSKISNLIKDTNLKLLEYEGTLFNYLNNKQLDDSEIKSLIKHNNDLCKLLNGSSPFSLYEIERDYKIIDKKSQTEIETVLRKINTKISLLKSQIPL